MCKRLALFHVCWRRLSTHAVIQSISWPEPNLFGIRKHRPLPWPHKLAAAATLENAELLPAVMRVLHSASKVSARRPLFVMAAWLSSDLVYT